MCLVLVSGRSEGGGGAKLRIMDCFVLFLGDTIITGNKMN